MKYLFIHIMFLLFITGCSGETTVTERVNLSSINEIPQSTWQKLSQKKIYFGHQSVGNNIIDGILDIMETDDAINLNIKRTNDIEAFSSPIFAHSDIGKNGDTDSKFNEFREIIQKGIGDKADIAFLKLCFWDIRRETDIEAVFDKYKETTATLQAKYPKIIFIHLTVPLMSHPDGIINKIKRVIKPDNSDLDNIKRNELNKLIVQEYGGRETIFDIALVESTFPDGRRAYFSKDGKNYYYLPDEYTNDGGHLNKEARKYVAEQLLVTLARLVESI